MTATPALHVNLQKYLTPQEQEKREFFSDHTESVEVVPIRVVKITSIQSLSLHWESLKAFRLLKVLKLINLELVSEL